jgi:RNA polymerase sigma factor (sigma-70 family)
MEPIPSAFESLMAQVRAGSQEAARELFLRYSDPVRRVVRRWIEERMRRTHDSADFEQAVWASFFLTSADRYSFAHPEELIAFLSRVAYNKIRDAARQAKAVRHGGETEEQSLDGPRGPHDARPLANDLAGPMHTPSKYVIADEQWQSLTRNLPPGHVRILELMREGHTQTEIAARLGRDRKAIQRLLDHLQEIAFPS